MTGAGGHVSGGGGDRGADGVAAAGATDAPQVPGVDPAWERSARFWLRAYPRRWRAARGEELLGVLADLARPGAVRVDSRAAIDLLRGGWATRWRGRPPLATWVGYRVLERAVPREHRAWAADDIDGYLFVLRDLLSWRQGWFAVFWLVTASLRPAALNWLFVVAMVAVAAGSVVVQPEGPRHRARVRHLVAQPGELLVPGLLVPSRAPRPRLEARWVAVRLCVVLGATAVGAAIAAVLTAAPIGALGWTVGVPGVLLLAGLVWVAVVGSLESTLAALPPQPHRTLLRGPRAADLGLVVGLLVVAADIVAEATGLMAVRAAPWLAGAALFLLPAALVATRAAHRVGWLAPDGSPLAAVDLVWVASHGSPPAVDAPAQEFTPYGALPTDHPVHRTGVGAAPTCRSVR